MERRRCIQCGQPAEFSLSFLISTLGHSPRRQKCTTSIPFCSDCIQAVMEAMGTVTPPPLIQPLRESYTALEARPDSRSDPSGGHSQ